VAPPVWFRILDAAPRRVDAADAGDAGDDRNVRDLSDTDSVSDKIRTTYCNDSFMALMKKRRDSLSVPY
jgi:hypothetical protein